MPPEVSNLEDPRRGTESVEERISTGIRGLDDWIGGGLPIPSLILITGGLGTGKTTLCTQFLCHGASQRERGIYFLIFKGTPELAVRFACMFDFADKSCFGTLIRHLDLGRAAEKMRGAEDLLGIIRAEIADFRPRRMVIDAPSILEYVLKDEYRRFLLNLARIIKEQNIVALVTGEASARMPYPADIACISDGIIVLCNSEMKYASRRSLEVQKMRGMPHASGKTAVDISSQGLAIYPGL